MKRKSLSSSPVATGIKMEKMIRETAIDYVGLARPLMANPDLINQFYQEYVEHK